jgi:hypothetical protein
MHATLQFCIEHKTHILALLFAASEALGANPKVKANGILSLAILGIRQINKK